VDVECVVVCCCVSEYWHGCLGCVSMFRVAHFFYYSSGIFGMDFFIVLIRAGYRVARRKQQPGRVGKPHRVTKEESMEWFRTKYEGILL
jgi:hypothetical protein